MIDYINSRTFVSETDLPYQITKNWNPEIVNVELNDEVLSRDEFNGLMSDFSENIDNKSKRIVKKLKGNIEGLEHDIMYAKLDDKQWLQAALITELFREHNISKNAGNIDTYILQEKIYASLNKDELNFLIGWGQAKRSCGGLKTDGYFSDFSECYAIMTLQVIMNCIYLISEKPVTLTVLTGGGRFYPALFTSQEKVEQYDNQRQIIADFFANDQARIYFSPYRSSNHIDKKELDEACAAVGQEQVDKFFKTVLLNVDWFAILSANDFSPHGIPLPATTTKYVRNSGNLDKLIMMAIVCILNRDSHNYWLKEIVDMELFDDTIDFFYEVTYQSARKYIAIHLMDADIDNTSKSETHSDAIRLTVHDKKDRRDIPAIYTLGRVAGNKLSQHVCAVISDGTISFRTKFEILQLAGVKKVYLSQESAFDWLRFRGQPFFYSNDTKEVYLSVLRSKLFYE
ncbi:hypothetical protein HZI31_19300 [Serratia fonticola]|uniref:hypothetical protein n=1 Tax=Serratia fonticola TaxID=47917 RepID=UPI0015C64C0C|nr:hypothetical protein [Serratia fonticola]NYA45440.1 hypothetical protein [Serratia fonticola]